MKSGADHIQSLRDGRVVFIDGRQVADVTTDLAFRHGIESSARLYDLQSANSELMTFAAPDGVRTGRAWQLPLTHADLVRRRQALTAWAATHLGFMGRTPDHVASCISGMYMGLDVFEAYDRRRAEALRDYYHLARDHDIFLAYALSNPQSRPGMTRAEGSDSARVVDEDSRGVTIRGAKILATGAVAANEVLVTSIGSLEAGDEALAMSVVVPLNARGLKILCRSSYELAAPCRFDKPLSSRYDENDALLYFEDVSVPWERVFVAGDRTMCQRQFFATPAHIYQNYQSQIRLVVKLRFLTGLAKRLASINGIEHLPQIREKLGQLAAQSTTIESLLVAMEVNGTQHGPYFVPNGQILYAAQVQSQQLYPRMIDALRLLAGSSLLMLPSSAADMADPQIAPYALSVHGCAEVEPEERVKLFRLAWDAISSEFASRQIQYETFYAGPEHVVKKHAYRTYDWGNATRMVDDLLGSYSRST
jgi:4-hydroxyphenylacetate 3-monooxygenase